jgi:hypothetical protein
MRHNGEHKRNDLDGLIYTRVTLHIFAYGRSHDFEFAIKGYHDLIKYRIDVRISEKQNTIQVTVEDADYDFKKALFLSAL